jgi:hypothetical protein
MLSLNAVAQNVSIQLSIHQQLKQDIFNEDSVVNTPMLNVMYQNNSNKNVYFKKVSWTDESGLPITGYGSLMQYPYEEWLNPNWRKRAEAALSFSEFTAGNNYIVEIGGFQSCFGSWHIVNEADTCIECETDLINDCITDIHAFVNHKKQIERFEDYQKSQFHKEDLPENSILNTGSRYFVFLKPGEIHTDTFNIIAFKLIKGNFTFSIGENIITETEYVDMGHVWNETQKRLIRQTVKLPDKVGNFNLYTGAVLTNNLQISF